MWTFEMQLFHFQFLTKKTIAPTVVTLSNVLSLGQNLNRETKLCCNILIKKFKLGQDSLTTEKISNVN